MRRTQKQKHVKNKTVRSKPSGISEKKKGKMVLYRIGHITVCHRIKNIQPSVYNEKYVYHGGTDTEITSNKMRDYITTLLDEAIEFIPTHKEIIQGMITKTNPEYNATVRRIPTIYNDFVPFLK